MRSLIALLLLVCCVGLMVGCDDTTCPCCPDCPCPDGVCPDCPNDACPDGVCPADPDVFNGPPGDVVDEARGDLDEIRGAAAEQPAEHYSTPDSEIKREGRYKCQRCGKSVVGKDWHNVWANGAVATFLCEHCWQALNADEREAHLKAYLDKQNFKGNREGLIEATRTGR